MRIAVLSGKGGTGKTFLAVNLALVAEEAVYADCDVEEPNGWVFLQPEITAKEQVTVKIPAVDHAKCSGCRKCVEFCRFNALAYAGKVLVFPGICHSCGGCVLLCPQQALAELDRPVGIIQHGRAGHVQVRTGYLNLGEESGVPIIAQLLAGLPAAATVIIDCPPGSSCTVLESIKDCDYCLLVAEPTRYGLDNLQMVRELVTVLKKPFGVVLNKAVPGEKLVEDYCRREQLPLLAVIPYTTELAHSIAGGEPAVKISKEYYDLFAGLLQQMGVKTREAACHPQR